MKPETQQDSLENNVIVFIISPMQAISLVDPYLNHVKVIVSVDWELNTSS